MAPPRTYDVTLLQQLLVDQPGWSYQQYADALTQDMRTRFGSSAKRVSANTVACAISRHGHEWTGQRDDLVVIQRTQRHDDLVPWHLGNEHKMDVLIRKLRTISRLRRGQHPAGVTGRRDEKQARDFEAWLKETRQVVDLNAQGQPVTRPARPEELDSNGELIEIVAQPKTTV